MLKQLTRTLLPRHPIKNMRRLYDSTRAEGEEQRHADAHDFWASSVTDPTTQDLSHWLGKGRWGDEERWRAIGETHLQMSKVLSQFAPGQASPRSLIEWGPGGGANLARFASEVPALYGVDISEANLRECGRRLDSQGFQGFRPVLIPAGEPEQVLQVVTEPVDFFLSTAVYQHFPSKDYGVRVTRVAHKLLARGGVALIQIRYDDDTPRFRTKVRDYRRNAVTFTSYRMGEFWRILDEIGLTPLAITLEPRVNYAYYFCRKAGSDV